MLCSTKCLSYDDTIINNIILGDNIDENIQIKVKDILKENQLDDLINPAKGINTFVGENGKNYQEVKFKELPCKGNVS